MAGDQRSRSVRAVFAAPRFRQLYAVRLAGQLADGLFATSLASAVLFNPEHATAAGQVAAGFAVVYLPYSLVGPFAGVFLDRWRRARALVGANLVRVLAVLAVAGLLFGVGPTGPGFYLIGLVAVSLGRFVLAALSAALPHVVGTDQLVVGNSVATTSGTIIAIAGGGLAVGLRVVFGAGDAGDAQIALIAAGGYLAAALLATRLPGGSLGPERTVAEAAQPVLAGLRQVLVRLADGGRHLRERRPAADALAAISAHHFFYGLSTVASILVYRNYFHSSGALRAGLTGLGQAFTAGAIGILVGAALTPTVTRRISKPVWVAWLFAAAGIAEVVFGAPYRKGTFLAAAFVLGLVAQGSKVSVDTIVQESVAEDYRGRVFSVYDMLFNLTYVAAALVGAFALPPTGKSYPVLGLIAAGYAATAVWYAVRSAHDRTGSVSAGLMVPTDYPSRLGR